MRSWLATPALLTCLVGALACGGGSDGPVEPVTRLGVYTLQSVGGQGLPATTNIVLDGGTITSISSGRLTLHDNGTHTSSLAVTLRATGSSTSSPGTLSFGTGVATITESTVTLARESAASLSATFTGTRGLSLNPGTPWPTLAFRRDQ